jgi:hypothetical protein
MKIAFGHWNKKSVLVACYGNENHIGTKYMRWFVMNLREGRGVSTIQVVLSLTSSEDSYAG